MTRGKAIARLLIIIIILMVINLISNELYFRLDFTEDQRYTLSSATTTTLEELDDVITVTAYFTGDLPAQLMPTRNDFEDLLTEYEQVSDGNVVYEFLNPNESPELETQAQQKGIQPLLINVTESDQVQQLRAYMGAVLRLGEKTEIIPVVQPGTSMEYSLTTSIKKISVTDRAKIAVINGHGEASLAAMQQLAAQLNILYDVEDFTITDTTDIPSYYKALMLINPTDSIPVSHLGKLEGYLASGGNVFIAHGIAQADMQSGYISKAPEIGIEKWLSKFGLTLDSKLVTDANSASVGVRQQQGPFVFTTQVQFPYFPILNEFGDHPASEGLESLVLQFANPILIATDSTIATSVLALTSENTGTENMPTYIDVNREWQLNDFNSDPLPVAVALEGPLASSMNARLVLVGNGSFAVNGQGGQAQQVNEDNINFASNIVDWLADDTGLVALRTKGITNRPLDKLEDGQRAVIKYGNFLSPILLILIYGLIHRQRYRSKKNDWLQGNY